MWLKWLFAILLRLIRWVLKRILKGRRVTADVDPDPIPYTHPFRSPGGLPFSGLTQEAPKTPFIDVDELWRRWNRTRDWPDL